MARPKCGFKKLRIVPASGSLTHVASKYATWDGRDPRLARKGELYLSGAEGFECAYEAPADQTTAYFIAVPLPVTREDIGHG